MGKFFGLYTLYVNALCGSIGNQRSTLMADILDLVDEDPTIIQDVPHRSH